MPYTGLIYKDNDEARMSHSATQRHNQNSGATTADDVHPLYREAIGGVSASC